MPVTVKVNGTSNSLVHKGSNGVSTATIPDVCKTPTPGGPVPMPYPNVSQSATLDKGTTTVTADGGMMIAIKGSEFSLSNGDNPGVAGGVKSSTFMKESTWILYSFDVKMDGANACRLTDKKFQNHENTVDLAGTVQAPVPGAEPAPAEQLGTLTVRVLNVCNDSAVDGADVCCGRRSQTTGSGGEARFDQLTPAEHAAEVTKRFTESDYITFVVHYPRILIKHNAESSGTGFAEVPAGGEGTAIVRLEVFRLIPEMVFHRRHIDLGGEDKYGHWWTVVDGGSSYGWWPKYPIGSRENRRNTPPKPPEPLTDDAGGLAHIQHAFASMVYAAQKALFELRESGLVQTFRGVEGELNGQTSFGGTATRDPHEIGGDQGDEQYQPIIKDCRSDDDVRNAMVSYAHGYSGNWSWRLELGNHCHTFQKGLMSAGKLKMFKVLR
jgi:hypothetical protein